MRAHPDIGLTTARQKACSRLAEALQKKAYHVVFGDMFKITRLCYSGHLINISSVAPNIWIVDYSFLVALKSRIVYIC